MIRKVRPSSSPEQILQRACLEVLRVRGVAHWRVNVRNMPNRTATNCGMADVIAVGPRGSFWAIEFKPPGEGLNPHQLKFCYDVRQAGGHYSVISSVEQLEDHLHQLRIHGLVPQYFPDPKKEEDPCPTRSA